MESSVDTTFCCSKVYQIGGTFIYKRIEDTLNRLSEQYAKTIETRIKNMVPMVTEEFEKEETQQEDNDLIKLVNIPLEFLSIIE